MIVVTRPAVVETVSSAAEFEELEEEWDALVCEMPRPSPFLLHAWLSEWWRHYGEGGALAVHVVRQDGRLIGALPLMVGVKSGLRVVRFMGGRQSALSDLLLASDADDSVASLLAERLAASDHRPRRPVRHSRGKPDRRRAGAGPASRDRANRGSGPRPPARAGRRSTKRGHRRRREACTGGDGVSSPPSGGSRCRSRGRPSELEAALEDAFRLHALRWEGRPDGSGFVTPTGHAVSPGRDPEAG